MKKLIFAAKTIAVILLFIVPNTVLAGEIIYNEDIQQKIVPTQESLVRTADNVIVLLDTTWSMARQNKTYGKTLYELEIEAIKNGIIRLPDLGYNVGIYRFSPWEVVYSMQKFNREAAIASIAKLPDKPSQSSPLVPIMKHLETVLQDLRGKTVIYIFTDGDYVQHGLAQNLTPATVTMDLAKRYDVCFQLVDYSELEDDRQTVLEMSKANFCSQTIPFDSYIKQPLYALAPLYYSKWDTEVETLTEKKVAGYKVNNIQFQFDSYELSSAAIEEIKGVGEFLSAHSNGFAALFGYTDDTGKPEYNVELSRRRAEAVARYLYANYHLGSDRVIAAWYGAENPIGSNDTDEGRAKNRRVEISIGGF